jgi:sec-independent protein translocase protein TatB
MFGIGFTEFLLIAIIAILFLGPDKLPQALVDVAKFIKKIKITVGDAKSTLEEEMKIADLKEEALGYKKQLDDATQELRHFKNLSLDDYDDASYSSEISTKSPQEMVAEAQKSTQTPQTPKQTTTTTPMHAQKDPQPIEVEQKQEMITFRKKEKPTIQEGDVKKGEA